VLSLDVEASGVFSRGRHVDRGPYLYDIPTPHFYRIYDQSICQIGELAVHLGYNVRICVIRALARLYGRLTCTCIATYHDSLSK